jgi:chitosanase
LNAEQSRRFFALTAMFETSDVEPDYGTLFPMQDGTGDGRGYCAGLVSFCSNTDDMADVIDAYTQLRPGNPLARFVPRMRELANTNSMSVLGLEGLDKAWNACNTDPLFRKAQEQIRDREYLDPALELAGKLGIQTVLGRQILFDTAVQHGVGGTTELASRLAAIDRRVPADGTISEKEWLLAFLKVRRAELEFAGDSRTRDVWSESAPRADALANLVLDGAWDFCSPLQLKSRDWNNVIP